MLDIDQCSRFYCIGKSWNKKKNRKFAEHLAKLLVKDSRQYSRWTGDQALHLFPDFPSNVTELKREIELKYRIQKEKKENIKMKMREQKTEKDRANEAIEATWQTPLFLASASRVIELVKIIVDEYPEAISHVNEDGLNILHLAIKHRQLEIYEFIEESSAFKSLLPRISKDGRTILHQAASMEYYREQALRGMAYQLQDELEWHHVNTTHPFQISFSIRGK